jgi:site-specific recombinase XerD
MKSELTEYDPKKLLRISPLDQLYVPLALNGERGAFRMPPKLCEINANTDLDAIKLWLAQYDATSATYRSYRQSAERLINWALCERGKPLSSLDEDDFIAFERFLANPLPIWRWISCKGTARSANNWTPLNGPLSPKSILQALVIIRVMCDWLRDVGYCNIGRSLKQHSVRALQQQSALSLSIKKDQTPNVIRFDDWQSLRRSMNQGPNSDHNLRVRMAVELMYYGSLTAKEIAAICIEDLLIKNEIYLLKIRSRPTGLSWLYLVPPLAKTIDSALKTLVVYPPNLTVEQITESSRNAEISCTPLVSVKNIDKLIKGALLKAANLLASEGNSDASDRLESLVPYQLRHAFEVHAANILESSWIWPLIGAAKLLPSTTWAYLPKREKLSKIDLDKAFCFLAPCWGGMTVREPFHTIPAKIGH